MSKAVKKVFKKVKKVVNKVVDFVKKNWVYIVAAVAAVFTAGAALGYVGMAAGGGLAFGAGAGVGGWTGISTAFAALGNTALGAVGMNPAFSGTVTQTGAAVQGLGTGGLTTASGQSLAAGQTATFSAEAGGLVAAEGGGAVATAAPSAAPGGVEGGGEALLQKGGEAGAENAVQKVGEQELADIAAEKAVETGVQEVGKQGVQEVVKQSAASGLTTGEMIQLGGVGLSAGAALLQEDEKPDSPYTRSYADVRPELGRPYAAPGIRQNGESLLTRPPNVETPTTELTFPQVMLDDAARKRYNV